MSLFRWVVTQKGKMRCQVPEESRLETGNVSRVPTLGLRGVHAFNSQGWLARSLARPFTPWPYGVSPRHTHTHTYAVNGAEPGSGRLDARQGEVRPKA